MLEVNEYEIDSDNLRQYGLSLPTSFQVFNIPSEIRRVLGSDAQPVIDQLNKTGTIDPIKDFTKRFEQSGRFAAAAAIPVFRQGAQSDRLHRSSDQRQLSQTKSYSSNTERAQLRAVDGEAATFRVGSKFPMVIQQLQYCGVSAHAAPSAREAFRNSPLWTLD